MKLEDIHAYVAVVTHESLTAAADSLSVQQPAITRRVQSLEKDLGVVLLDRSVRPSRPTPIGEQVFALCRNVMRNIDSIEETVRGDAAPAGRLRIGVAESLAEVALGAVIPALRNDYPSIAIEVVSGWSAQVVQQLQAGAVDAAIAVLPSSMQFNDGFAVASIGELPMTVVARKDTLPTRQRLEQLKGFEWILNPEGCGFRDMLRRALDDRGLPLAMRIATFGTEQKLGLVASGAGLGFVPECVLNISAHAEALQPVELSDFSPKPHVWRICPNHLGRRTECVVRFGEIVFDALQLPAHRTRNASRGRATVRRSRGTN